MLAIGLLLREADSGFTFRNCKFTADLLDLAYIVGADCGEHVEGDLYGTAIGDVRTSSAGEPARLDLRQRDEAEKLARFYHSRPRVAAFYRDVQRNAEARIEQSLAADELY
jgi:hypothetical protein